MYSVLEICVIITVSLCLCERACVRVCVRAGVCMCHMYRAVLPIFMYIKTKYRTSNPCVTLGVMFFCQAVNFTIEMNKHTAPLCL